MFFQKLILKNVAFKNNLISKEIFFFKMDIIKNNIL